MTEMAEPSESILLLTPVDSVEACAELAARGVIFMLGSSEQADILRQAGGARIACRVCIWRSTPDWGAMAISERRISRAARDVQGLKVEGSIRTLPRRCVMFNAAYSDSFRILSRRWRFCGRYIDPGMTHACASLAFACMGDLGCDAIRVELTVARTLRRPFAK